VPTAAPFAGIDFPMRNNIFFPFALQWLVATHGRASQGAVFMDSAFWSGLFRRWHESGRPLRELDAQLGIDMSTFHEWLDHPQPDGYWDACNPAAEDYARLELPILTITGSYDDDQPGALEHYRNHIRRASPAAQARHYLIIGPWDHSGAITPAASFGGLSCGSASLLDLRKLHVEWYAWTLQNGPRPEFLRKRVAYYVMGSERWRYAETLDSITARHEPFFLDSNGHADDVYCSGTLKSAPGSGPPDTYRYDPRDTSGPEVAAQAEVPVNSIVDQRLTSALQGKCVVYHSAPFERDTEVSGFFRLSVWLAIDCPDTDFYLSIYDVAQDGSCIRLSTDALRARYREGLRTPKLIDTSKPLRYDCERFTFVSREIRRGHRLRLVIAPLGRLMETTFSQKNYQAGGVVANESAEDGRPVSVSVHHDEAHPSVLYVPFGRTDD
jgi:putative CocE/NonD family hydrolase